MILAALTLAAALPASAVHIYPISPVRVGLRVETDRVVADIDAESTFWIEEVLELHPLPPSDWPAPVLRRAEEYANAHLRLGADGSRLTGRLTNASFVQRPWQVNERGRVLLRLVYPAVRIGAELSGESDFYEDYRREMLEALRGRPLPFAEGYRTLLRAGSRRFDLRPGAVSFALSEGDARPGCVKRSLIAFAAGAGALLGAASSWPALAALALLLAPDLPSRRRLAGGALCLAAGLAFAALRPVAPDAAVWAAGLAAALAAAGRSEAAASLLAAATLLLVGWFLGAQAAPWLPAASPGAGLRAAAAVGTLGACAAALAGVFAAARAERSRLETVSQSHAAELFARRRRLAATVILLACGYGLSQNLPRQGP
ncbi:MAG TPA: hypothetical protein DCZ01_00970 [Elusimicrobia bacterium]|nr:MAG: hypothetical protein A2X37_03070 [Elusimicrobia bacterium GWA2_66_18]HAZ07104.1 hypothetical protein [Elusimicrobiota bacterium]